MRWQFRLWLETDSGFPCRRDDQSEPSNYDSSGSLWGSGKALRITCWRLWCCSSSSAPPSQTRFLLLVFLSSNNNTPFFRCLPLLWHFKWLLKLRDRNRLNLNGRTITWYKLLHPATCYCHRGGDRDAIIVPKRSSPSDHERLINVLNLVINNCVHNNVITKAVTHNDQQGEFVKRWNSQKNSNIPSGMVGTEECCAGVPLARRRLRGAFNGIKPQLWSRTQKCVLLFAIFTPASSSSHLHLSHKSQNNHSHFSFVIGTNCVLLMIV